MGRRWRAVLGWMVVAGVVAGLVGASGPGAAQARLRPLVIVMPTTPPNLIHIPPWVAMDTGIFARYGLQARILTVESGVAAMRTLVGSHGEVHIAAPGVPPFVALVAHGGDVKAVATYAMRHPVAMVVQPGIRSCQDLRGKKLGTPGGMGAYVEVMIRAVLQSCGLTPRDVQYINVTTAARVSAMVTGQIDGTAAHLDQVYELIRQKPGLHVLATLADLLPKGWYAAYVVAGDLVRSDPTLVRDAVMALVEANRYIYQHRQQTIDIAVKYTKEDRDALARAYDDYVRRGMWPVNEGLHRDLVEEGLDTEVRVGNIPASEKPTYEQVVDISFLRAAMTKLGRWTGDPRWY